MVEELKASGQLDGLFAQIDAGQVELTGDGGFVPALVKAALERGLQAELSSHLGYEKGSVDASAHGNSRNGTTPKTVASERSGRSSWTSPGTGRGPSLRAWCPRVSAGWAGWTT